MIKLASIASISTGYTFRSRIDEDADGNFRVIQIKDFDEDDNLLEKGLIKTSIDSVNEKFIAREFDILFKSRGVNTRASLVQNLQNSNIIISSPLVIIRVTDNNFSPAYIQWYINHSTAQRYFEKSAKGSSVRMIDMDTLNKLEVPILPIQRQYQILEAQELIQREKKLMDELYRKRQILLEEVSLKE